MKRLRKQIFALTTMFVLLIGMVLPYRAQAAEPITVAQAIANNTGTATVAGYIVGYTTGGSNGKATYDFDPPFRDDLNFAIADSPTERDATKILPIQITSGFRPTFGLATNPSIIGKKVFVTGSLQAYFTVPGLRTPTAMSFDSTTPPPEEPPVTGETGLKIRDIQGQSHTSPYKDKNVVDVPGVVTYVVDSSNFYMQDPNPDDSSITSEGLLVYKPAHNVAVGDRVNVSGLVKEWVLDGYDEKLQTDLAMTEINAQSGKITKVSSENQLPAPLVIGRDVIPPTSVIDNDQLKTFDPSEDGIDFYESLEGMLVSIENPTITGPQKYGEIPVITSQVNGKAYTKEGTPLLTNENQNPEKMLIQLDDRSFETKAGDSFNGTVTGVVSYTFSNFKILTKAADLPNLIERERNNEVTTIQKEEDKLTIAGYNIENFVASDTSKRDKLAKSMVENLGSPDIIGLVEVLDESGETNNGVVTADANYKALSDAIKGFGGPTYAWTEIAPVNGKDGGVPGGNIRVGYLYNPQRVTLNEAPKGNATSAVAYENGSLTLNPGRIDPTNEAFNSSRKPLAAEFTFQGEEVIVINNHFNSKGGDQPLFGKNQPPYLESEAQRVQIATIVNNFVSDIKEKNKDANVVVLGDLNDFEFSVPLAALKGDDLTNLVETLPASERYTYNYQGNAQVLDHILVSNNLAEAAKLDIVNFNSPYMEEHGRASDHDALVAQLDLAVEEGPFTLSVLHTNDTHAYVEQFPKLITAVNEMRSQKENSLLLNAGDVFSGTLYFRQYSGLADLYFMNQLDFDAMTLGNHEFDKDSATLANFIKQAEFPIVSSNVNMAKDADLGRLFNTSIGGTNEQGEIFQAIIKEVDGEEVGIFGLTTEDTSFLANPGDNIEFENAVEKANETIDSLEAQGVDKIIALSHLGYQPDLDLAEKVDGIDVIVGGHSHTKLDAPVVVEKEEPTLIVQANEYLKYLGVLDVIFDENGVIAEYSGELKDLSKFTEDAAAKAKVEEFKAPLIELQKQVVGNTSVALNGVRDDVRSKETNLGNLIADGMAAKANEFIPTYIAMQNGGGIRASIDQGDITLGEILTVLPFGNNLVTLELTGEEILAALEHSVSTPGAGGFMQVSGLKFKYDPAKPVGDRVWHVEALTGDGYEELQLDKLYRVATNAFTADGGDGYSMFKTAKDEGRIAELYIVDFEVFTSYLEKVNPVSPVVEGRIVQEVEDSEAPEAPSVNEVTDQSTQVTGTSEPGAIVEVSMNGTVIGSSTALENGSFIVEIAKQAAGTELSVTATDGAGNVSDVTIVTVVDVTPPVKPKVYPVIHNDTVIIGTTEAGASVKVMLGKVELGSAVADADGKFKVSVPKQKHKNLLSVTATDAAGNVSKATIVDVLKKNGK
ncbi:2',3'-cyclic-nucleotide 2'-phosphodiesterase (5'-nucleotidase family) [Neobacillus niacini]|uniref:5'-nucleotidase C-terminal domain-containing protein n=1 Tax=Neobacillus driksii TaxID=3035913 RepID=UPI00277DAD9B|nr:5'-nucleotidase C-terminal domain-containing protein [Neobacillus niacini]MDQ0971606.1 2',3'-cyclic-nucleotide 2'-phosphodiesterase (5'-nucleotidase family) [Neobacillus niacini]